MNSGPSLLCVANFPANTGFAWDFIERIYARLADSAASRGIRTFVAYPELSRSPRALEGCAAEPVLLDARLESSDSVAATTTFIRRHGIQTTYFADQNPVRIQHAFLRAAGVRRIVVHDHTSGERRIPSGPRRLAKYLAARAPLVSADLVLAVSDFVARRHLETGLLPAHRIRRIYNGIPPEPLKAPSGTLHARLGISRDRPLFVCMCRATEEKGVQYLLRAFDRLADSWQSGPRPALVYLGDGPYLPQLQAQREAMQYREDVFLLGYVRDAAALSAEAVACVVPSTWQEAFGLAVVEPMLRGVPVIASDVGAIPELVKHGESGWTVPPRDVEALASAMRFVLANPGAARAAGENGRRRARIMFSEERMMREIVEAVVGEADKQSQKGGRHSSGLVDASTYPPAPFLKERGA